LNRKSVGIAGTVILILLLIFGTRELVNGNNDSTLNKEKINEIISTKYPGKIISTVRTNREGNPQYKTVLKGENGVYVIWSDANSGEILKLNRTKKEESVKPLLSKEEAAKIAAAEGKVLSSEFNKENKIYLVTIEKESKKYTVEINANSGKIQNIKELNPVTESPKPKTKITEQEARQIAQKEVKATITEVELDDDDGVLVYEIEVETETQEGQVIINAFTGEVASITMETKDID
jgi:uncharacterized membrane protein YkoI